jgi:hypothetical protein
MTSDLNMIAVVAAAAPSRGIGYKGKMVRGVIRFKKVVTASHTLQAVEAKSGHDTHERGNK